MFTKKITDDDRFYTLPSSTQLLYFHLSMAADDDGFNNQVSLAMFKAHASVNDLETLLDKRYVYQFENGVIVIKHWRMANALRKDRYTPTVFQEELNRLGIKENGSYTFDIDQSVLYIGNQMATKRQPNGNQAVPQDRIDKDRLDKDSIDKDNNINVSKDTLCCTQNEIQRVVDAWNALNLSKVNKVVPDTNRYVWLKKRMKEYGVDGVLQAIENVKESDFLMGKTKEAFNMTFDWLVRPNNFPKVLDGNYTNKVKANNKNNNSEAIGAWLNGKN